MKSSNAYDFEKFSSHAAVKEETVSRVTVIRNRNANRAKNAFRSKCLMYAVIILALMTFTVYNRLLLTQVKTEISDETSNLTKLQSTATYLNFQLESKISMENVEKYASENLGLIKFDSSQIEYVNLQKTNLIEKNEGESAASIKHLVETVINLICGK